MEEDTNAKEALDAGDLQQKVMKAVTEALKIGNGLPKLGEDFELCNSFPVFSQLMKLEGQRLLQLMTKMYRHAGCKIPSLSEEKDDEEKLDRVIDANDAILERVGNLLDEAAGIRRQELLVIAEIPKGQIQTAWNKQIHGRSIVGGLERTIKQRLRVGGEEGSEGSEGKGGMESIRLLGSKHIPRPQTRFQSSIDNSNSPFVSKLKHKHNPIHRGQGRLLVTVDGQNVDSAAQATDVEISPHPYQYELLRFNPSEHQLESSEPSEPPSLEDTPYQWINTPEKLTRLASILKQEKEFAVDLEHHGYRSFLGLTCLMQISTRKEDFLVDTLALWNEMHVLNDPFSDAMILKVFHGAEKDIEWLQRDFGIYVVNLFDTGQAMRFLRFPRFALSFLIKHYLNKDLDKQYQLADWRIRPLPEELVKYAREDAHYLLYCKDRLKNELLKQGNEQKNLLKAVYDRSRDLCLTHYEKPLLQPDDYLRFYETSKKHLNSRQLWCLQQLYGWRDKTARIEDESIRYVLPDHMLLQIAESLPKEMQGILACCNPVPPLVKQHLHELHRTILQARDRPLDAKMENVPIRSQSISLPISTKTTRRPHDFSHATEDEQLEPMALLRRHSVETKLTKKQPTITAFGNEEEKQQKKKKKKPPVDWEAKMEEWISPFEQYQLARTALEEEAKKDEKEEEKDSGTRKMYSHKTKREEVPVETKKEDSEENKETEVELPPPPEKKRKRKRGTADVEVVETTKTAETEKGMERRKRVQPAVEPFNYGQFKPEMFNDRSIIGARDVFDPHRRGRGSNQKKGGKGQNKGGKAQKKGGRKGGKGNTDSWDAPSTSKKRKK